MSKLDNDLYQVIKGHASWTHAKPDDLTIQDSEMKPLIGDMKDLMLELIGEDSKCEKNHEEYKDWCSYCSFVEERALLKAELRQKVSEL